MGDKAAEAVEEASKDGPYLSLDDFRQRTKVSKTVIDLMADLGLFGNLPQSNQISLFDPVYERGGHSPGWSESAKHAGGMCKSCVDEAAEAVL